jgi:HrpA-like RNA helicase
MSDYSTFDNNDFLYKYPEYLNKISYLMFGGDDLVDNKPEKKEPIDKEPIDKEPGKKEYRWDIGVFDPDGINPNPLNSEPFSQTYKTLSKFWSGLPAYQMGKQLVETINANDVILIKSFTGSGKTVLVPKFCLHVNDYKGKIIITLPKKIITKKAAEFAAKTLDVELGEQVGYQFRGDNSKSNKTILLYSTDGSVISMCKSDPELKSIDMVIIDEAHERKVNIDLLLYLIKNAIVLRQQKKLKPLKLIVMSATINEALFQSYYSKTLRFNWMELSGTPTFPIQSVYLESSINARSNEYIEKGKEIIGQIIKKINSGNSDFVQGDILFFVCTIAECDNVAEELGKMYPECFTMGLYSGFDAELEPYISNPDKYKELDPRYKRRIFVSTNVAESSLTIDGIVYVIDSGLEISVGFNPDTNTNVMTKNFITQAQMTQRKGRAGRTKPGICFHLYTPQEQDSALRFPEPEIKCIDLKNTCLSMMKMCSDIANSIEKTKSSNTKSDSESEPEPDTKSESDKQTDKYKNNCGVEKTIEMFTHFIEPPGEKFITNGFDFGYTNGLIGKDNTLSKLGRLVVESRLDVMDGITLVYAYNCSSIVFKAVFKIITICSYLKSGPDDFFNHDIEQNIKSKLYKKLLGNSDKSEHVLLYNLFKYIGSNKNSGMFNLELFDTIENTFNKQYDKIESIYSRFDYKLHEISKKNLNSNIINSFGFGYKSNRAFRSGDKYKYLDKPIDMSKSLVKDELKTPSIIFYANLQWFGKLSIMICSPYLLE